MKEKLEVLKRLHFVTEPVAVGFLVRRPQSKRLQRTLTLCEMVKEATEGKAFFVDVDNHKCEAGAYVLGWKDLPLPYLRGEYGVAHGHFKEPRAMRRIYRILPRLESNIVTCLAFAPISKLDFTPDLILFVADFKTTRTLLRASTYTSGRPWKSIFTGVLGCAWLLIHPYLTGEPNCLPSNFSAGMEFLKVFPENTLVTSVPFDILPALLENLAEMPLELPLLTQGEEFRTRIRRELGIES